MKISSLFFFFLWALQHSIETWKHLCMYMQVLLSAGQKDKFLRVEH